VWADRATTTATFSLVQAAAFTGATSTWGAPATVVEGPDVIDLQPRIAMLASTPNPAYLVVAQRRAVAANAGQLVGYRCVPEANANAACEGAGVQGGPFLPLQQVAARVSDFELGSNAAGDVVVAWRQFEGEGEEAVMMASRSSGAAGAWREVQAVTDPDRVGNLLQTPQVHVAGSGVAVLAWSRKDNTATAPSEGDGVFVRRFTPVVSGPMVPAATVVVAASVEPTPVALSVTGSGKALLLWSAGPGSPADAAGVFSCGFDATMTTPLPGPASRVAAASDPYGLAVARGDDGKGVAVWVERTFSAAGIASTVKANRYR
jgi:hypothetical protein